MLRRPAEVEALLRSLSDARSVSAEKGGVLVPEVFLCRIADGVTSFVRTCSRR